MKRRVILAHGWASAFSGRYDIDRFAPFFEAAGYEVVQFDYGFHLIVSGGNGKWAHKLREMVLDDDLIVGHSNAAVLIYSLSWQPLLRFRAILLNPVLDRDVRFGPSLQHVEVFHTPTDLAVRIAGLLPWHPWGWAGATGIRTGDPRVTNHDMSKDYPVKVRSHLGVFREPALSFYGPLIARLA